MFICATNELLLPLFPSSIIFSDAFRNKKHDLLLSVCTSETLICACNNFCITALPRVTCHVELHSQVKRSNLLTWRDRKTTCLVKTRRGKIERSFHAIVCPKKTGALRETETDREERQWAQEHCWALRQTADGSCDKTFISCWSSLAHFMGQTHHSEEQETLLWPVPDNHKPPCQARSPSRSIFL